VTPENRTRLLEALETAFHFGKGHAALVAESATKAFSNTWSNPATGFTLRPPSAALFSFNNPLGACPKCRAPLRRISMSICG